VTFKLPKKVTGQNKWKVTPPPSLSNGLGRTPHAGDLLRSLKSSPGETSHGWVGPGRPPHPRPLPPHASVAAGQWLAPFTDLGVGGWGGARCSPSAFNTGTTVWSCCDRREVRWGSRRRPFMGQLPRPCSRDFVAGLRFPRLLCHPPARR